MDTISVSPRVYAALYLSKKKPAQLVSYAQHIHDSINGNAAFTTPEPYTLIELQTAIDDCSDAVDNAGPGCSSEQRQDLIDTVLILQTVLSAFRGYVEGVANLPANILNAAAIIISAGMQIRKTPEATPVPEAVTEMLALYTNETGKILTKWKRTRYSRFFEVYMTPNPADMGSWVLVGSSASKKLMVESLSSGNRYYFRVVAVGTNGRSAPGTIASCIAA